MFISVLDLFKVGIGPSSSHTMGPMAAARAFRERVVEYLAEISEARARLSIRCTLYGSLALTGRGHATDRAVLLGLHGYLPAQVATRNVERLIDDLSASPHLPFEEGWCISFRPEADIVFDSGDPLPEHPNALLFELLDDAGEVLVSEIYFSIGGGFIATRDEISRVVAPLRLEPVETFPFGFDSARAMLRMAEDSGLSIAEMKWANEICIRAPEAVEEGLDSIWICMRRCVFNGLEHEGELPGGLGVRRRAANLYRDLHEHPDGVTANDWLCAYAMAVNEENAAGHLVVTAPTNGAAGVIPAVLYYLVHHEGGSETQIREFLLTAAAIGGIIKHRSSISGAEVGCQGEVGSAAAMAAAGLCAARGGTPRQIEHAAEMALEHHLGLTCDPVRGLVQVPCIERNGFGAIKAYAAASLAMRGRGEHFMPLDACIAAMKQIGEEMSIKFKETSLGGLAVSVTEC